MSFNVARWRPAPLAPRSTGWGLWAAVSALTLAGAMGAIVALAGVRSMIAARSQWMGTMTVVTVGAGLETSDAAAARIEDLLKGHPGILSATVQDPRIDDLLIGRLMGVAGEGTQTPRFLAVRLAPDANLSPADLTGPLAAQGLAVRFDDHRSWSAPVEQAALMGAAGTIAGMVVIVILLAVLATHAARLGVRRVRGRMALLASLGATRGFLAAQFPTPIALSAMIGGLIGAVSAVSLTLWGADRFAPVLAAGLALDAWDLPIAAVWPLLAGLIAWVFAWLGAAAALKRVA